MINFLKFRTVYFILSAAIILLGLFSIIKWGYRVSIDFVGGTNLQYKLEQTPDKNTVKNIFNQNRIEVQQLSLNGNEVIARAKAINETVEQKLKDDLAKKYKKVTVIKSETVGPVLGGETIKKTIIASLIAIIGILIYMSFAFKSFNFALATIVALIHDFLVVIGTYSLISHFFGAELDTLFVTAILTSMSFSVHDTIIIFDKMREYRRAEGIKNIEHSANRALTETLVRSFNNSMTIIFMLTALALLGGVTIKFFVITLLIGTVTGTYSSPFIATPVLVWLERITRKR